MRLQIEFGYSTVKAIVNERAIPNIVTIRNGKEIVGDPKQGDLLPTSCGYCEVNKKAGQGTGILCTHGVHELVPITRVKVLHTNFVRRGRKKNVSNT